MRCVARSLLVRSPMREVELLRAKEGIERAKVEVLPARRYRILRTIYTSWLSRIYLAEEIETRQKVVIKVPRKDNERFCYLDRNLIEDLLRESRIVIGITHLNLARGFEVLVSLPKNAADEFELGLVLEHIEGRGLDRIVNDAILSRRPLPFGLVKYLSMQLCDGLGAVHEHGWVHRDVRPGNILVARNALGPLVKVIDFQLAIEQGRAPREIDGEYAWGSLAYMSPEQCRGLPVDQRADVFGVGVVITSMTCQSPPNRIGDLAVDLGSLRFLSTPDPALERQMMDTITRALKTKPDDRFRNMAEMKASISAWETEDWCAMEWQL